jgi:colanic acid/amylovoran biosynthesis glycosyltransferase
MYSRDFGKQYSPYLNSITKRIFDLFICALLLVPSILILLLLAVVVLILDGRPVFFVQKRSGKNGKIFCMPKIRTLKIGTDPDKPACSYDINAFTTTVGKFLRRYRLDELPQIFVVMTGRMSLVGPRPELPIVVKNYSKKEARRLITMGGITGLWQVKAGRDQPIHKNIRYDLYYLRKASLWLDIKILIATIPFVLNQQTKGTVKKIAYILAKYPCSSESFVQREIAQLQKQGFKIFVFATDWDFTHDSSNKKVRTYYRPAVISFAAVWSIICITVRHPVSILKIIVSFFQLLFICPSDALTLLGNVHTICFFARTVEKEKISHIHAYFLSWPACIALGLSKLTRVPFSIAAHARDIFVESGACGLKVQLAKYVTCCSRQGINHLKGHIDVKYYDKLFLNYHSVEINGHDYSSSYGKKNNSFELIVAVGRLVSKKGFDYLLKAFAKIVSKRPNVVLIIAGDGPKRWDLEVIMNELGLENNVHLAGWVKHSTSLKLIEQAKALIVPSVVDNDGDRDGIPNVILEAFSVGTPVIASSLPGISEAVSDERTGLLVEPANTEQLAVAIERLLSNDTLAVYLINNARAVVKENFDIEKNCQKLAQLFEKVIQ